MWVLHVCNDAVLLGEKRLDAANLRASLVVVRREKKTPKHYQCLLCVKQTCVSTWHITYWHNVMLRCMLSELSICMSLSGQTHTNLPPRLEGEQHVWCVQEVCSKLCLKNRDFFTLFLLTIHNDREKVQYILFWIFGVPANLSARTKWESPWLDFGSLTLFCPSGQPRFSCCAKLRESNFGLYILLCVGSHWLQGSECFVLSAVFVWSQSLYTFTARLLSTRPPQTVQSADVFIKQHTAMCTPCILCQFKLGFFFLLLYYYSFSPAAMWM